MIPFCFIFIYKQENSRNLENIHIMVYTVTYILCQIFNRNKHRDMLDL